MQNSIIPEQLIPIYKAFKDIAIMKEMVQKDEVEEELQKGFLKALNKKKTRDHIISMMLDKIPVIDIKTTVNLKRQFLKKHGIETIVDPTQDPKKITKQIDKQVIELHNKLFDERTKKFNEYNKIVIEALNAIKVS